MPAEGVEARDRDGEQQDGVCDLRAWQKGTGQRGDLLYRGGDCLMGTRTGYQTMRAATCIMVLSTMSRRMANRHRSPCGTKRRVHFPLVRTRLPRTRRSTAVYSTNDKVAETNSWIVSLSRHYTFYGRKSAHKEILQVELFQRVVIGNPTPIEMSVTRSRAQKMHSLTRTL